MRKNIVNKRFGIRDLIKFGLIQSGHAMDFQTFETAQDISARSWLEKVNLRIGDIDLKPWPLLESNYWPV